jgi:hypothetical protein
MADFQNPKNSGSLLSQFGFVRDLFTSVAKMFDGTSDSNVPTGAKRIVGSSKEVQEWNGSSWTSLGYVNDTANAGAVASAAQATADSAQSDATQAIADAGAAQTAADSAGGVKVFYVGSTGTGDGSGKDASNLIADSDMYANAFGDDTYVTNGKNVLSGGNYVLYIMTDNVDILMPARITNCKFQIFTNSDGRDVIFRLKGSAQKYLSNCDISTDQPYTGASIGTLSLYPQVSGSLNMQNCRITMFSSTDNSALRTSSYTYMRGTSVVANKMSFDGIGTDLWILGSSNLLFPQGLYDYLIVNGDLKIDTGSFCGTDNGSGLNLLVAGNIDVSGGGILYAATGTTGTTSNGGAIYTA